MKNIQIIDGAENCAYSVYQTDDQSFFSIFPLEGQDIEFIDDLIERLGYQKADELLAPLWEQRLEKHTVVGIHGTLFYELGYKKRFYPNKRETDLDSPRSRFGPRS